MYPFYRLKGTLGFYLIQIPKSSAMKLSQNTNPNWQCTMIILMTPSNLLDKQLIIHLSFHLKLFIYNYSQVNKRT